MKLRTKLSRAVVTVGALANGLATLAAAQQPVDASSSAPSVTALPSAAKDPQPDGTVVDTSGRGNPLWSIPLASLAATRERPIFSPSRRPRPAPPMAPPPPPKAEPVPVVNEPPRLTLLGAIAGEPDGVAIFVDETTKTFVRLRTGEAYSGWILRSVKGRAATLEKDRETAVVAIAGVPAN